jgi:hypothetical protein
MLRHLDEPVVTERVVQYVGDDLRLKSIIIRFARELRRVVHLISRYRLEPTQSQEMGLCQAVQLVTGPLETAGSCHAGQRREASSTTRAWRMSCSAMNRLSSMAFFMTRRT